MFTAYFIGWYLVFIFLIPSLISNIFGFQYLRFYFPIIDLIANTFTISGEGENVFKNVYKLSPDNFLSYISTNFINLLALAGVSWNGIVYATKYKSISLGVFVTLIMYTVTYLLPTQGIPFFIRKIEEKYKLLADKNRLNIYGYMIGITLTLILYAFESVLVHLYIKNFS